MEQLQIKTTYGQMNVYKVGNGKKKVVLLHGAGSDHALLSWREVLQQFDDTYTVYAPDFLSYGKSEKMIDYHNEFFDSYTESIKQLADALSLHQFLIAGLSMGGSIAINFTLKYPERISACVPVNTWGVTPKLPMHYLTYLYIHKTKFTVMQYKWMAKSRWMTKLFIRYSLIYNQDKITDALVDEVIHACTTTNAEQTMLQFQRSSVTKTSTIPYFHEQLKTIQVPVTYIHGKHDPLVAIKDVELAAAQTPNSRFVLLENCRHWSVKEEPEKFVQEINRLFGEN